METLALIFGLFVLVTFFMPWVNVLRANKMRKEMTRLQKHLRELEKRLMGSSAPSTKKSAALEQPNIEVRAEAAVQELAAQNAPQEKQSRPGETPAPTLQASQDDWIQKTQDAFEKNIATKLPVWVGSISLIGLSYVYTKFVFNSQHLQKGG